jgi:hypothetical protein
MVDAVKFRITFEINKFDPHIRFEKCPQVH